MGITQHRFGGDAVQMVLNLGLSRDTSAATKTASCRSRGHSSVQGGAEMGAYSTAFPGGKPVNAENASKLEAEYGFPIPNTPGLTGPEMVEACSRNELDVLYCVGGNFSPHTPRARLRRGRHEPRAVPRASGHHSHRSDVHRSERRRRRSDPASGENRATSKTTAASKPPPNGASASRPRFRAKWVKRRTEWKIFRDLAIAVDPNRIRKTRLRNWLEDARRDRSHRPHLRRHPKPQSDG